MAIKQKISDLILNHSSSYLYYKKRYEKIVSSKEFKNYKKLENDFNELKAEHEAFKKTAIDHLESSNFLLKTLYLDYDINEPRPLLNLIQSLSTELLVFVNNVCKKHGLNMWLDYGTLLGAVRHGNFVPWDDSIDISMMRNDYLKFMEILSEEIKDNGLENALKVEYKPMTDDTEENGFIQILIKNENENENTGSVLSELNIFPYDYISHGPKAGTNKRYAKSRSKLLNNINAGNDIKETLNQYYEDLSLGFDSTEFIIPGAEGKCGIDRPYKLNIYNAEVIFPLSEIKFNDNVFNCPNDSMRYLKSIYKDYLAIPVKVHKNKIINSFRYNKNNDEIFGEYIEKLKEINAKF